MFVHTRILKYTLYGKYISWRCISNWNTSNQYGWLVPFMILDKITVHPLSLKVYDSIAVVAFFISPHYLCHITVFVIVARLSTVIFWFDLLVLVLVLEGSLHMHCT